MAITEKETTNLMDLLKTPVEKQNFKELRDQIQFSNAYYLSKNAYTLGKILNNPGLQHLAENIFDNLNFEDLEICQGINQSSKQILEYQMDKPTFLLKKFRSLSNENQKDWMKVIESAKNSEKEKAISVYLQWNLKKNVVDLPCYTNPAVQDDFKNKIFEICNKLESFDEDTEIVKMLTPLTDNLNAQDKDGHDYGYLNMGLCCCTSIKQTQNKLTGSNLHRTLQNCDCEDGKTMA